MKLEKNASICMKAYPFWIIPYTFYMYYLSLFLMEKGLSSGQIAALMTICNLSSLFFSFLASPIVDRLGRKNATTIFDIVSSAVPALIYFLSQNYVFAIIAMVLNGMNRIMSTSFYLIMIEDTSDENSMQSMNMFNIITVVAGLLTPIAGIMIDKMGLVKGEKFFLMGSAILMTAQALVRHFFIEETPTGKAVMAAKKDTKSGVEIIKTYKETVKQISKGKDLLAALIINAVIYVYYNIGTTTSLLFTPYFANYRNLTGVTLASVASVYAGGTLFSMLIINPRVHKSNIYPFTIVSSLVSILGFVLLILCPMGNNILLFAAIILIALSYGILKSVADALLAMETTGEFSSGIYSLSFVLSAILSVIALNAVQFLYEISPNWLFGLSLILVILVLFTCLWHERRKRNA